MPVTDRPPSLVELLSFNHDGGYCFTTRLPAQVPAGDTEAQPERSPLILLEDGVMLGPSHTVHANIRNDGGGRFSHWKDTLYFSASDNSDPRDGRHRYHIFIPVLDSGADSAKQVMLAGIAALDDEFTPDQAEAILDHALACTYPPAVLTNDTLQTGRKARALAASRYRNARIALRDCDVSFLSIMKSGRTWVRYFVQQYITEVTGVPISLAPRAIPRIGFFPSIYFHHGFFEVFDGMAADPVNLFEEEMALRPLILLTRDPRDVLVSYYYYTRKRDPENFARWVPSGSFDEFLQSPVYGLERIASVESLEWDLFERHPGPKLKMSYEDMIANTRSQFEGLLRFLTNSSPDPQAMVRALASSEFKAMQALDIQITREGRAREHVRLGTENWSGDKNELAVRSGQVGGYRALRPDLGDRDKVRSAFPKTAQLLDRQLMPTRRQG